MFCIHCGKEIPDGSVFCTYCGKRVGTEEEGQHKKETDSQKKSTDSAMGILREVVSFGQELINEDPGDKNNVVCPFCKEGNCEPITKNVTEVTNDGYKWGSGCCGLVLLGPFGLLCGLCGSGSKTKTQNEVWWVCKKCGKQHISSEDASKKWDTAVDGLAGSGVAEGIIFLIFKWLELGTISSLVQIACVTLPIMGLVDIYKEISGELGESLYLYLSPEQKKKSIGMLILSCILVLIIGQLGGPLLAQILGG